MQSELQEKNYKGWVFSLWWNI